MNNSIRDLQLKLLELMKEFHEVCNRNDIKYYMLGGTMLGAVRHRGFIPWDDDMDVGLPRKDYEKLLSLSKEEWPKNIRIKTAKNSKDLIFPYSKLMNIDTTLVEDRLDGIIGGIYIDIFPLDGAGNSFFMAKMRYYLYFWKQGLLYNNQDYGDKKTVIRRLIQSYARQQNARKLYRNVEKWMVGIDYYDSSIIGNYPGAWGLKEFMDKKYMGEPTLYEFEDTKLYGASDANVYLTSLYGNYMRLPSLEEQKSHRNFIYLNLELPYSDYDKNI